MAVTSTTILLFVPNLIGYVRIVLALVSFYYMPTDYTKAVTCYLLSAILDEFDGYAARALNQCTEFGAMLDQLTDRAATACLIVTLSHFYPNYMFWFQLSMALDIVSHWLHLHTSTLQGSSSHKTMGLESNPLMRIYYTSRPVLSVMCIGNECFFAMLYALHFSEGPSVAGVGLFRALLFLSAPIMALKTLISFIQLIDASKRLANIDANDINKAQ